MTALRPAPWVGSCQEEVAGLKAHQAHQLAPELKLPGGLLQQLASAHPSDAGQLTVGVLLHPQAGKFQGIRCLSIDNDSQHGLPLDLAECAGSQRSLRDL
eukprot:scaffold13145_cov45-Prasinocladus_malaysianus.AAC.1